MSTVAFTVVVVVLLVVGFVLVTISAFALGWALSRQQQNPARQPRTNAPQQQNDPTRQPMAIPYDPERLARVEGDIRSALRIRDPSKLIRRLSEAHSGEIPMPRVIVPPATKGGGNGAISHA